MRFRRSGGMTLLSLVTILCILLAVGAMIFDSEAFLHYLTNAITSLVAAIMPIVLTLAGLYILIRALFR